MTYRSDSSSETRALGARLIEKLSASRSSSGHATTIALVGELGTGKTTFVRGMLGALGVRRVSSPTFIIMRRHQLRGRMFAHAYHIDAYRLRRREHANTLGIKELLRDPENLVIVEWADQLPGKTPQGIIRIQFKHGKTEHERTIRTKNLRLAQPSSQRKRRGNRT